MERIWTIVINEDKKCLLLKNEMDEYVTVTGTFLDSDNNYTDTIIREVKNNTSLNIKSIENTRVIFQEVYDDKLCNYHIYITYVNSDDVKPSDKYSNFEWTGFYEFIDKVKYDEDKDYLKDNLKKYLFM